jgi:hypothetical protein
MTHLEFLNFTPRDEFRRYADEVLDRTLASAPSDSVIKAKAFFTEDRFVLEISIFSSEGKFRASAGVPLPKRLPKERMWQTTAFDSVAAEVTKQLVRWRKTRRFGPSESKLEKQAA